MKLTETTRDILRVRRGRRALERSGFEEVGEGGGRLWELHRGYRWDHTITEVQIDPGGQSLWIKTDAPR